MATTVETIGIIGTGPVGRAIARRAVTVGIQVVLSNSRGPESLREFVEELGDLARAATPAETALSAEVVIAAVPLRAYEQLPTKELTGRIVIDTMNYAPSDDWSVPLLDSDELTSTGLVQRHLAGSRVVKAFNNFGPGHLQSLARPHGTTDRTAMPIAGEDADAKARVAALLDAFGSDSVDIGGLQESWRSEPNSPVYAFCYLPEVPQDLDGFGEFMAWVAQAPGVTVTASEVEDLVAAAVRGPAGFRLSESVPHQIDKHAVDISYRPDVKVPMRDGTWLATDIWIPHEHPAPALVVRLPYGKTELPGLLAYALTPNIFTLLEQGYAIVWQDCRGTYASEGVFVPMATEAQDGVDTLDWVRQQPWCNGDIGTYGASYLGMTQWMTAGQSPEGLAAVASSVSATDFYAAPWYSPGGAMSWHTVLTWSILIALGDAQRALNAGTGDPEILEQLVAMAADPTPHLRRPAAHQKLLAQLLPWWTDWIDHPDRDDFWSAVGVSDRLDSVRVPALHVGGWFDIYAEESVRSFNRLRAEAGTPEARDEQRLIIGPWDHWNHTGVYPDRQFGLLSGAGLCGLTQAHVNFFDRWVRGRPDALDGVAPVRIFVMGIDEWRDEDSWPLADTTLTDFFLGSTDSSNSTSGRLTATPSTRPKVDRYDYDPADPVPSVGGRVMALATLNATGPTDQRSIETRQDVLTYTTDVLDQPMEVTGHVSLILHVSSTAADTDFTAKLVDVHPDGRALYLTDGILRMRYRDALDDANLMTPGETYEVKIHVGVTSNVFLPGHRIRLEVSSSNFPRYDRNTNTGGAIAHEDADQDGIVATNQVLYGPAQLSRLILPIIHR